MRPGLTAALAVFLLLPGRMENAWAHGGTFILAKCAPQPSGGVVLELTVDYSQHPYLTDRAAALQALTGILQVETAHGPVPLESVSTPTLTESNTPDPDLPLPADPMEAGRIHQLLIQRYQWQPSQPDLRFSVPRGNPHDVLFWLAGTARDPTQPAPWRILISGDQTPPVPLPPPPLPPKSQRLTILLILLTAIPLALWWRRKT